MSDPALDPASGPAAPSDRSDLRRFLLAVLAAAIVLVTVFLLIRAGQQSNSERNYQDCLSNARAQAQADGLDVDPEDVCQKPE